MSKVVSFRVPNIYTYSGDQVKSHLDNFFQWCVDNIQIYPEMTHYPEWELIKAILGGWK